VIISGEFLDISPIAKSAGSYLRPQYVFTAEYRGGFSAEVNNYLALLS
jgi:hypothetical protein